ncbi:MAG: hypothetical protein LH491_09965, partial [Pseudoxanthomonas sp.]|nr:hypothetical protein [Pseudoxanthomonas sp.]
MFKAAPASRDGSILALAHMKMLLLGLLLFAYAFVYVNQVGLPDFVKRPLLAQLQARGLNMDFSRLRVRLG